MKNLTPSRFMILALVFALFPLLSSNLNAAPYTKDIPDDVKISILSATASSFQSGEGIERSYDGNKSTLYHSRYSRTTFPVTLIYDIQTSDVDYIQYSTRVDGNSNGNFKQVEIQKKSLGESTYTTVLEVDLNGTSGEKRIEFPQKLTNVVSIRLLVKSGAGGFASCSEMGFYQKAPIGFDMTSIFTDETCSALKPEVTQTQVAAIPNSFFKELATDLFNGSYSKEFRYDEFKSWPHPSDFSRNNRVGTYSLCDNPTGIYVERGDTVVVFASELTSDITLCLKDYACTECNGYYNNSYYGLQKGINKIVADRTGLFYVQYFRADHLTAPKIKLHFAYGKVNGYFDNQKHTSSDWTRILNATHHPYFDVVGKYAHLSFPTARFKKNAATTGLELINAYDELVKMERTFLGYYKYPNRDPYNRSHLVVMYTAYMYSAGNHTAYNDNTLDGLTNYTNVRQYPWGPAHEVGHSNQHSPMLKWVGLTEVTNNINSLYVQTQWGNTSRLTEEKRYQEAYDEIIVPKLANSQSGIWSKLVSFWQLQLFFSNVLGQTDFYSKIYEAARTRAVGGNDGEHQLNFVKMVTDSTQVDLTEFFDAWGFLKPVDQRVEDYWTAQLTVTQAQSDAVKAYIKDKNLPTLPYKIQYITDTNWEIYKNKAAVEEGTVSRSGNTITSNWKNVVAYECYRDGELVKVSATSPISFAGRFDNTCEVYAVQYDGTKYLVMKGVSIPAPIIEPKISDDTNTYWYYIKNMNNAASRSLCSLNASAIAATIKGTSLPLFQTQKWKLTRVSPTTVGVVNEQGLYLGRDMKATDTPYGWTLEKLTQYGSSGYRFKTTQPNAADPSKIDDVVAHLGGNGNLMNYTPADEASIWQFIPTDIVKVSNNADTHWYDIQTYRTEDAVVGKLLTCSNENQTLEVAATNNQKWKVIEHPQGQGNAILNSENKYITILADGSVKVTDTPPASPIYLFLTTAEGVAGIRIANSSTATKTMLLTPTGTLSMDANSSIGTLWNFTQKTGSGVKELQANAEKYVVTVKNRKVHINDGTVKFNVYAITGKSVRNENLQNGIYIVRGEDFATKVIVK